jgi:hypothetical protein
MKGDFFEPFPHLRTLLGGAVPLCELGPGRSHEDKRAALAALDDRTLFAGRPVKDKCLAKCCYSGLWLVFDFLDESHQISQDVSTVEGSYWHGIMHRREPDFDNAKYWFRRVPRHPVFETLCMAARQLVTARHESDPHAGILLHEQGWDPFEFIDLCEAIARGKSHCDELAREVARKEWELLFRFCYEGAL